MSSFDPDEFFPSIKSTKVVVTGDFLLEQRTTIKLDQIGAHYRQSVDRRPFAATRVAKFLAGLGFQVSVVGLVNEDDDFLEIQEHLFTSKVNVSGLKTAMGLSSSVVEKTVSVDGFKMPEVYPSVLNETFSFKHHESAFREAIAGSSGLIVVDSPFLSLGKDDLLHMTTTAALSGVRTFALVCADDSFVHNYRYFQTSWMIGQANDIVKIMYSCKLGESVGLPSLLKKLSDMMGAPGGVLLFNRGSLVTSCDCSTYGDDVDWEIAGAVFSAVVACGYAVDQALWLASKCSKGITPEGLLKLVRR